ncbi:SRPBCC domain-containing protein [Paenibacillus psychroresistens]|uniref:SRPBCC domain-containing protein n=1 Tax=Paenibacillus psychroresistens TaxID=1778678 RepID=A0A6B8REP1_9BACL|nr:SRPBCC family protein [Paenibacillus psychroresistens]QGQ93942.1 SRPBCC domain-containing protein [Paenibacillus psychroresistens]
MTKIDSTDTLTKELFIECRPETLFKFFIDPEKMIRWMGNNVLLEPKNSGKFRIDLNGSDIAMGEYIEIIENEKIVMTWGWEKSKLVPPGSSTVEFLLTPKDNGTLLLLTHYDLPVEEVPSHQKGWTHFMTRIKQAAEDHDPGMH